MALVNRPGSPIRPGLSRDRVAVCLIYLAHAPKNQGAGYPAGSHFVAAGILLPTVAYDIVLPTGLPVGKRLKPADLDVGPDETG